MEDKEILSRCLEDIKEARSVIDPFIDRCKVNVQLYDGDSGYYDKLLSGLKKSNLVSRDIADAIQWAMPALMRIFFGGQSVGTIQGVEAGDEQNAENLSKLINWQLTTQNNFFIVFHLWAQVALLNGIEFVKGRWNSEKKWEKFEAIASMQDVDMMNSDPNIEVTSMVESEVTPDTFSVTGRRIVESKSHPVIENIPITEIIWDPNAKTSISECRYIVHRKEMSISDLRKMERDGIWKNVGDVIDSISKAKNHNEFGASGQDMQDVYRRYDGGYFLPNSASFDPKNPRSTVYVYEYYTQIDLDGDGILDDAIITFCGDTILRKEENPYGCYPFFPLCPFPAPFKINGDGFGEMLEHLQNLQTALMRQIIINISANNQRKCAFNAADISIEDLTSDNKYIPTMGNPKDALKELELLPYDQSVYQFKDSLDSLIERRSGVNRYYQGTTAEAKSSTATGVQSMISASSQRIELVARIFAETGLKDLYRWMIRANQLFLDANQAIRVNNTPIVIAPDDIAGKFDYGISVGLGLGDTDRKVGNLQMLIQILTTVCLNIGITSPNKIRNAVSKLVEQLGYKDFDQFLMTDEEIQAFQQQQAQQQAMMMQQQAQQQMQTGG